MKCNFQIIKLVVLVSLSLVSFLGVASNILPLWKETFEHIEVELNKTLDNYQQNNKEQALQAIKDAQYKWYKNSDLETAIRINHSIKDAEAINREFSSIIQVIRKDNNQQDELKVLIEKVANDIQHFLPNLPLTYKLQEKLKAQLDSEKTEKINNKDYIEDKTALKEYLNKAVAFYRKEQSNEALNTIKQGFYTHWQESNLAGSIDDQYRLNIEHTFDQLYKSIQQNKSLEDISKIRVTLEGQIDKIEQYKIKNINQQSSQNALMIILSILGIVIILAIILFYRKWGKRS